MQALNIIYALPVGYQGIHVLKSVVLLLPPCLHVSTQGTRTTSSTTLWSECHSTGRYGGLTTNLSTKGHKDRDTTP